MSAHNKEFLRWEVKPLWIVTYPSALIGVEAGSFTILGVDRGSLDIVRNWEKIQSVEQFNQGFVAKPEDFTFTIAVKERGEGYEKLRRLAIAGIVFDVACSLIANDGVALGDRPEESESTVTIDDPDNPGETIEVSTGAYIPWMDGFEKYKGCIVQREGQTVELATFPVREFECEFLRHEIKANDDGNYNLTTGLVEGGGTHPHLSDLIL